VDSMARRSMLTLSALATRDRQPELMDQPGLAEGRHVQALRSLVRINRLSGSAAILWRPIRELARQSQGGPLRILDVATGAGDVPIRLWEKAHRAGIPVEIAGCDVSPTAIAFARQQAAESAAGVRFFPLDVLREPLPEAYDIVTCSLFLHHLE